MIERIYAENFRAFKELDLELSKINLFFGPNNSGKSSILSLVNVLSQTLLSSDHTVPLLLRGTREDLGTYRDVIHNNDTKKPLVIGIESSPTSTRALPFYRRTKEKFKGKIKLEYNYKSRRHEIFLHRIMMNFPSIDLNIEIEKTKTGSNYHLIKLKYRQKEDLLKKRIDLFEHFLPAFWNLADFLEKFKSEYENVILTRNFYFNFIEEMKNIEFIGPFREPPSRTYLFSGESPESVGTHGERAVDIMTMDYLKQKGKQKKDIVKKVSKWFKSCGISEELIIQSLTDRHFEVVLSQIGLKENIVDVGYGCSQVLPILVAGYNLNKGDILIVQEPEIHLHPKAQAELGTFFYQLSQKNIQSLIETHSEHLLLRLQAHIADKNSNLNPEDVKVYYVYINQKGERVIENLELKDDGFFKKDWPQGFFPERYNEAKKIAKASLKE